MNQNSNPHRQRGFFAIGIGVALLAAFGGISVGIKEAVESAPQETAEVATAPSASESAAATETTFAYHETGE